MSSKLLTLKEAEEFLQVSESTIFRLIKDGKLRGFKVGREWRFKQSDIDAFIEEQLKEAKEELSKDSKDVA